MSLTHKQEAVKEKIISVADDFFGRFGFYKTTMEEIARKIHKAKGVLYYYFKSKEDLYTAVVKRELRQVKEALKSVTETDDDPVTKLENYVMVRFEKLNQARNYHETLQADFREQYGFVESVRKDFELFERAQLKKILTEGKNQGYFQLSNIDLTLDVVIIILKSVEIPLFLQNKYTEYKNIIVEMLTLIFNGLKKN